MKQDHPHQLELLADLAKLLLKYGPDTFLSLSKVISDGSIIESIEKILTTLATQKKVVRRKLVSPTKGRNQVTIRQMIERIGLEDKEKAKLLSDVIEAVKNRSLMPQLKDIRLYFQNYGIDPTTYKSRERLTREFFKLITDLPNSELEDLLSNRISSTSSSDRDLGAWAKIILKDEKK